MRKLLHPQSFVNFQGFIPVGKDIPEMGVRLVGYFPYEVAQVYDKNLPRVNRSVFGQLESTITALGISDNKVVFIFQDLVRFGATSFALQLKDGFARVGSLYSVKYYDGQPMRIKGQIGDDAIEDEWLSRGY